MKKSKISSTVALAWCAATTATAGQVTLVTDVRGPEGPLYLGGNLYFVGWISDTLSKWDGKTTVVLNHTPGCGHNGLALTKRKTFLVACDTHGAILELDMTGKQLRRWDADSKGRTFDAGINDIVVTANDSAYATMDGPNTDPPTSIIGKVLYLAPDSQAWVEVADGLNYANGIGVSPDQNKVDSWFIGPDSMKIDTRGNIYTAQWFGGKILKISPEGKLLHVFEIAAGDGTTNVAFGEGEKDLYVTVVKDPNDPQMRGTVVKIENVE